MNVDRVQYQVFGGSVLNVTTMTFVLPATWMENTTVNMHSCALLLQILKGIHTMSCTPSTVTTSVRYAWMNNN